MDRATPPRRFTGISKLYGEAGFARVQQAHVCVVGVGGVGSWAVEALARSGVGTLTLIDLDHVAESNINRQLHALDSQLGKAKVQVLVARVHDINPDCQTHAVEAFINLDNQNELIPASCDYIIDCIDHAHTKAALIAWCRQQKKQIITVGGSGGKLDPTQIQIMDLSRTKQDVLLSKTRKALRQKYEFPRNLKRRFCVPAVVSPEEPVSLSEVCDNTPGESLGKPSADLSCSGMGSITHCTATFAFFAVSRVLSHLSK